MAFTLKRRRLHEESSVGLHFNGQYTGIGCTRLSQLNIELLDGMDYRFNLLGIPEVIQELDELSVDLDFYCPRALEILKDIYGHLVNYEPRRVAGHREEEDDYTRYAKVFIEFGGVEVMVRLLMYSVLLPSELVGKFSTQPQLRVKSLILQILSKLVSSKLVGEALAQRLTTNDDMLNYAFELLAHDKTCIPSCQFLEDMLQARKQVVNLTNIRNLKSLLSCLDDRKLANFCRILAITISDLDIYENKLSLFAQNEQKRSKGFVNVRDVNQELLLSIPNLISRLVDIAVSRTYTPRFRDKASELDCWMEWIENSLSDDLAEPQLDDLEGYIGGICEASIRGGYLVRQPGLEISNDLIMRVQVIYVLGLFLVGKHRKKVQKKLAELNIVPGLSEFFSQFIWKCDSHRSNSRNQLRGHNSSCECSPEVALKIQFLRLVHSLCDHSDYKHLLLSRHELEEVKRINAKAGPLKIDGLDNISRSMMCRGSKGLLTKIVEVMKKEPTTSTFRFWLARAVESYLRGNTSYCDQIFLLRKDLLQHIAGNIVNHDIRPKEILQSSFDLLGELVKFNIEAYRAFDKVLNTEDKAEKFLSVVNKSLVDSNMFIRALILSLEHFTNTQPEYKDYAMKQSELLRHIGTFEHQITYLQKLINLINVQNLTQENVSCLNTTLVFLMFGNKSDNMSTYLRALMVQRTPSGNCVHNLSMMKNFRDLLLFWQDHYLHKDKDCSALEKSSKITFDYWKETVTTLISDDRNDKNAVIHYMDPEYERYS